MSSIGEIQAHDTIMRLQQRGVHSKVGGRAGVRLNIHSPLLWVKAIQVKSSLLAQTLNVIYTLSSSGIPVCKITSIIIIFIFLMYLAPGYPSAYLLVRHDPNASCTALLAKFCDEKNIQNTRGFE